MDQKFYDKLASIVTEKRALLEEPMSKHTTFRVGGPADYFLIPETEEEVVKLIALCREENVPYYIVGNGSNLLVSDEGYDGAIIQIGRRMSEITVDGEFITARAGALLSAIGSKALEHSLGGFEFAAGIPGCLGGACVMNAGAYGGEMKDILVSVTVLNPQGEIETIPTEQLELGYRTSLIGKRGDIVLSAKMKLIPKNPAEIKELMEELKQKRIEKQPLEYPSAGSTFKRPEGYFAGKLIQDAGLKGFQVGGAQVSEKHSGFVINKDHATASDIDNLMRQVSEKVEDKFGVPLEAEVKKIGKF